LWPDPAQNYIRSEGERSIHSFLAVMLLMIGFVRLADSNGELCFEEVSYFIMSYDS